MSNDFSYEELVSSSSPWGYYFAARAGTCQCSKYLQITVGKVEKSVLDCLDYPSKINCDKADGSFQTLKPAISQLSKKCGFSLYMLQMKMIGYSFEATNLGNTPQVRKQRSEMINDLLELDEACKD